MVSIALLVVAVATNRYGIRVGEFNLRLEFIIGALLGLTYLVAWGSGAIRRVGVVEWCLAGWVVVGVISSLLFSPYPAESVKLTVVVAGCVMLYGVAFLLLRSPQAVTWAALAWVAVGAGVALIGLMAALLYIIFGWTGGLLLEANYRGNEFTLTPKVYSTLWEANIFGSFCLTVGLLAFTLSCAPALRAARWHRWLWAAIALAFCGVMLSMTRTAWVVGPVLLALLIAASLRLKVLPWRQLQVPALSAVLGIVLGLAIGFAMPAVSKQVNHPITEAEYRELLQASVNRDGRTGSRPDGARTGSAVTDRVTGFIVPDQVSSIVGRQRIYLMAFHGWLQRPILGWGTGSYQYMEGIGDDRWIPNLELHLLFDTGLVGFLLLALAAGVAVLRAVRALKVPTAGWDTLRFASLGLLAGGVGLFLAYQLTEGTWLGFTWVFFALLVAAGRYAPRPPESAPPSEFVSESARE